MASRSLDGETTRPPGLERLPEVHALRIDDLMRMAMDGRLRVPQSSHAIKWTVHDAIKLFDSIYQGYPIGTLLLWQRPGEPEMLRYGSLEIGAPAMSDVLWVVDGQQRIHSLARVLLGKGLGADTFTLYFDLNSERFVHLVRASQVSAYHLPMTEVLHAQRFARWFILNKRPEIDQSPAIRLEKRIRDYQIPVYIVHSPDEGGVREIYRRLNKTGRRTPESAVFAAIHGTRSNRPPSSLRGIAKSLRSQGFGELEKDLLLRMLRALLGRDVFEQEVPDLHTPSPEQLAALKRAARAAIELLRHDVGVPHHSLLPHDLPLIVLAAFFQHFPRIHPRSRELLSRWVWRGALTAEHQDHPLRMQRALMAIVPGAEHETIQRLLASVPHQPNDKDDTQELQPFALDQARCRIQLLAQMHPGPRHLVTGAPVAFETTDATRTLLPDAPAPWHNHLANRIIHPTLRRGLRAALLDAQDPELLATHLITPEAVQRLRDGNDAGFFAARAASQSAHISAFVAQRARWGHSDRPPLESLVVGEDD